MTFSTIVFSAGDNLIWSGMGRFGVVGEIGVSGLAFLPKE
jgi:hypothetical protein